MKERPILFSSPMVRALLDGRKTQTRRVLKPDTKDYWNSCPYGVTGDRLWVRETFYQAFKRTPTSNGCVYRADDDGLHLNPGWSPADGWRTPIFMPRWASRLALEITNVRMERLQEISEEDSRAEGMLRVHNGWSSEDGQPVSISARRAFEDFWHVLNAKRAPWGSNPWVWVLTFKQVQS